MSNPTTAQDLVAAPPTQLPANLTDPAQLTAMLYGGAPVILEGQVAPPPVTTTAPTPGTPETAAPSTQAPNADVQPLESEPGQRPASEGAEDRILPRKIPTDHFDDEGARAIALQHTLNNGKRPGEPGFVSLGAALEQVRVADTPPQVAPPAAAIQPTQLETLNLTVQSTEQKLAELESKLEAMTDEGTLVTSEYNALQKQARELTVELANQRNRLENAQQQNEQHAHQTALQKRQEVMAKVVQVYPTANDKESPLGKEVAKLVLELKKPGNPDRGILGTESAAEVVTERAAIRLATRTAQEQGIPFSQAFDALRAAPQAPVAVEEPGMPPRVLPGVGGTTPAVKLAPKTGRETLADLGTDPKKLSAAIYGDQGNRPWFIR